MERQDDRTGELEERSERLGQHIEEARMDWESKEEDAQVPGAQPEESDQLPEEQPGEAVPDDTGDGTRDEAKDSPGVPGEEGTATGNPDAAGSKE
jgi:hypothetical protein